MKKLIVLILSGFFFQVAFSQTSVVEFLKGGKDDASKLSKAYIKPYAMALGDGLNNGWYNSAQTHKLFGFDLTITLSAIQIPEESKTFDISTLGLTNMTVESGGNIAQTVAGQKITGPRMQVMDSQGNSVVAFNTPNGSGQDIVPVPMVQLGFGMLPNTDFIVRYVPEMKYDNGGDEMKLGLWGIGVKHNFMEWIPVLKELPFDASIFGSYSEVNAQSELSFTSDDYGNIPNLSVTFTNDANQFLMVKSKTTRFGLIVSKKISVLTVFGGIGQSTSESTIDLIGKYPVVTTMQGGGYAITNEDALIDPIAIQFDSKNFSMDVGIRLKLAFFSLFGSINKAEYTSYNVGISLGVR